MKNVIQLCICLLLIGSSPAFAAEREAPVISVDWENPRQYVDIRASLEPQPVFEEQLFEALGEFIEQESARVLEAGQELKVVIHNLDLAGQIEMNVINSGEDSRVVRGRELVMIEIEHTLLDSSGQVISEKREKFSGTTSRVLQSTLMQGRSFHWEKELIRDWVRTLTEE
ncbi:MAG: DUF3016 domain-containing protein [bacterium]|nr:DUF3016 domain-containing protein [bacterium]